MASFVALTKFTEQGVKNVNQSKGWSAPNPLPSPHPVSPLLSIAYAALSPGRRERVLHSPRSELSPKIHRFR